MYDRATEQGLLKPLSMELLCGLIYGATVALAKHSIHGGVPAGAADIDAGIDAIWDMVRQ